MHSELKRGKEVSTLSHGWPRVGVLMDFDDMVDEFSRRKARNKPKGRHCMLQGPSI